MFYHHQSIESTKVTFNLFGIASSFLWIERENVDLTNPALVTFVRSHDLCIISYSIFSGVYIYVTLLLCRYFLEIELYAHAATYISETRGIVKR